MSVQEIVNRIPVAFGDWVDLGPGPMAITVPSAGNTVWLAANDVAPLDSFDGPVGVLGRGRGSATFPTAQHVWAKVMGDADNGLPTFLTVTTEQFTYDDNATQPVAATNNTANEAYAAGNVVGGLLTFQDALGMQAGTLKSIVMRCKSVQDSEFKLYLFSRVPHASTWGDKEAANIAAEDLGALQGVYNLGPADSGLGTMTLYRLAPIEDEITSEDGNLYGILVAGGTPTFTSDADFEIGLGIKQRGE